MQKIILLRHAKALDRIKAQNQDIADKDRPLTEKGIREFKKQVINNKKTFKNTDLFVTSPYLRALETLDVLLSTLKIESAPIKIISKIRPEDTFIYLKNWLMKRKEKKIVVVSHEPFLSYFLQNIVGSEKSKQQKPIKIKKGAIINVEFDSVHRQFKLISLKNP